MLSVFCLILYKKVLIFSITIVISYHYETVIFQNVCILLVSLSNRKIAICATITRIDMLLCISLKRYCPFEYTPDRRRLHPLYSLDLRRMPTGSRPSTASLALIYAPRHLETFGLSVAAVAAFPAMTAAVCRQVCSGCVPARAVARSLRAKEQARVLCCFFRSRVLNCPGLC